MINETLRLLRRSRFGGAFEYLAQAGGGLLRPALLRSGAAPEEEHRALPGDDLVPNPVWQATRAVTIDASPVDIWPWIMQMGYGRGGFYGWNPLEREDTGAWRLLDVVPPAVGDIWLDGPGCDETNGSWKVTAVDPPVTLVLRSMRDPLTGKELDPAADPRLFIDSSWAFHLDRIGRRSTRLLARTRIAMQPRWALVSLKWLGVGDTVMQRRLLDGVKARVETAADGSAPGTRR